MRATARTLDRNPAEPCGAAGATIHDLPRAGSAARLYLGPATVAAVRGSELELGLEGDRVVAARVALAFPYAPVIGDVVLLVSDGDGHFVIGVLQGSGKVTLELPADVDLRARGKLRLSAEEAVEIDAPRVNIQTGSLQLVAGAVVQQFQSLRQRVVDLVSAHLGESHTIVERTHSTQARSARLLSEEKVTINGSEIHLG